MTPINILDCMVPVTGNRYFSYSQFLKILKELLDPVDNEIYELKLLGKSVLKESIYNLTLGTGPIKILMWSQMHGNESTTTRSLLPFIDWFLKSENSTLFELHIIPVLNPDGLANWTRENVNGIDLNRDAQDLSQPESQLLRSAFNTIKPDYCFNLHDQRTIYGTPDGLNPIQCSFLAPAANHSRDLTPARLKAMDLINQMITVISNDSIGVIGRYDDGFNINCVGDMFQSLGVPTVLFEAGQANNDYYRSDTVKMIFKSLQCAVESIAKGLITTDNQIIESYNSITPIETNYCDVLIKNVPSGGSSVDLSIMYRETLEDGVLYFVPFLIGINDLKVKNAHRIIDLEFKKELIDFQISKGQEILSFGLDIQIFY